MRNFVFPLLLVLLTGACNPPASTPVNSNEATESPPATELSKGDSIDPVPDADALQKASPVFPLVYTCEDKKIRLHKVPTNEIDPEMFGKEDFLEEEVTFETTRENGCIVLLTEDGSRTKLCDIPEDSIPGDLREYDFWGTMKGANFWLFHVYRYEGVDTEVVSKKTGEHTGTLPEIAVSPDKKYLMAYQPMNGFGWTSIEMYSIGETNIEDQWSIEMEDWGPESVYWAPDGQIYIQAIFGNEGDEDRPEHYLRVEVEEGP